MPSTRSIVLAERLRRKQEPRDGALKGWMLRVNLVMRIWVFPGRAMTFPGTPVRFRVPQVIHRMQGSPNRGSSTLFGRWTSVAMRTLHGDMVLLPTPKAIRVRTFSGLMGWHQQIATPFLGSDSLELYGILFSRIFLNYGLTHFTS